MSDLPESKDEKARRHWSILRAAVRFPFPKSQFPKQQPNATPTPTELVQPEIEETTTNEGTTTTTIIATQEKKNKSEKYATGGFDTVDNIRSSQKPQESSTLFEGLKNETNESKSESRNTPNQQRKSAWHILRSVINMLRHFWMIRKSSSEKTKTENKEQNTEIKELSEPKPAEVPPEWTKMDERLDEILKKASARIVQFEYSNLCGVLKQCLQHFAIFNLDCSIKKRTMIYWWIGEQLAYETPKKVAEQFGEDRFKELYDGGYIIPTLNYCANTFSEFRVHPLVHWMIQSKETITFWYDVDKKENPQDKFPTNLEKKENPQDKIPTNLEKKENPQDKFLINSVKKENLDKFPHLCLISSKIEKNQKDDHKEKNGDGQKITSQDGNNDGGKEDSQKQKGSEAQNVGAPVSKEGSINGKDNKSEGPLGSDTDRVKRVPKLKLGENTRVVYNISAKSPALDEFSPKNKLVVLQLGRWNNDQKTYIEVEKFESMKSIGCLEKLKYLGLEGVSRLETLPTEIKELKHLLVLDLRGCQNLEKLGKEVTYPRNLTHLDLTECYMLECIPKGVSSLSHLQVFKGFVFGGSLTKKRCTLFELSKLKKLRKFSINIISESKIEKNELKHLEKFQSLNSLTITWGELPVIEDQKKELERKWTNFSLPPKLEKFDIRCFPNEKMPYWFNDHKNLMKLYIRGGKLETLDPEGQVPFELKYLRLRYLDNVTMSLEEIRVLLPKLERLEVVKRVKLVGERVKKCEKLKEYPEIKSIWIRDQVAEDNATKIATANASSSGQDQAEASKTQVAEANATKIATANAPSSGQDQAEASKTQVAEANATKIATANAPSSGQDQAEASKTPPQGTSANDTAKPAISEEKSVTNGGSVDASSTKDATDSPTMEEKPSSDNDNDAPTTTEEETVAAPTTHETVVNQSDTTNLDPHLTPPTTDSEHKVPLQPVSPPTNPEPHVQTTQETAPNLFDQTKPAPIPPTTDSSKSDATIDDPKYFLQPVSPETDKNTHDPTAQMTLTDQSGTTAEEHTTIMDGTKSDSPVLAPTGQ